MITVIEGATGSAKTFFLSRLLKKDWQAGFTINSNFPLWFDDEKTGIQRWYELDELYHLQNGIIAIDEGQKLFEARRWGSLPISFMDKIAQHRKHHLDIYTTTQDIGHIDKRVRDNVHEIYSCRTIFRYPKNERVKPILQISKIIHKSRSVNADGKIKWEKDGSRKLYISKYFSKTYYNTYDYVDKERYLCKIRYTKKQGQKTGKWTGKIYSRELVNNGKARL